MFTCSLLSEDIRSPGQLWNVLGGRNGILEKKSGSRRRELSIQTGHVMLTL